MKAAFYTLGCKVNQYETEVLKSRFSASGYKIVPHTSQADVYIINTCTVTSSGDKKSRQILHRFRRQNQNAVIAFIGCYPQAFPELAGKLPEADIICGAKDKLLIFDKVNQAVKNRRRFVDIAPHTPGEPFETMSAERFSDHTRAFVKIEDGCDRYCSYCIIPKARGPVRSKLKHELKAELETLAENGYKEIVLVGINLSSYGKDINSSLTEAVELACSINGIERVRLGSLEPELLSEDDIRRMSMQEKFCPQFHLSLQSGCDETLKRMNRHYTCSEYSDIVNLIRKSFSNPSITTDIMVGFAGESEREFNQSLEFVKKTGFAKTHVFSYSVREGTKAALMPDQIPPSIKEKRNKIMSAAAHESTLEFLSNQIGRTEQVVFEEPHGEYIWGYAKNYTPVAVKAPPELCGKIADVKITAISGDRCIGEIIINSKEI